MSQKTQPNTEPEKNQNEVFTKLVNSLVAFANAATVFLENQQEEQPKPKRKKGLNGGIKQTGALSNIPRRVEVLQPPSKQCLKGKECVSKTCDVCAPSESSAEKTTNGEESAEKVPLTDSMKQMKLGSETDVSVKKSNTEGAEKLNNCECQEIEPEDSCVCENLTEKQPDTCLCETAEEEKEPEKECCFCSHPQKEPEEEDPCFCGVQKVCACGKTHDCEDTFADIECIYMLQNKIEQAENKINCLKEEISNFSQSLPSIHAQCNPRPKNEFYKYLLKNATSFRGKQKNKTPSNYLPCVCSPKKPPPFNKCLIPKRSEPSKQGAEKAENDDDSAACCCNTDFSVL